MLAWLRRIIVSLGIGGASYAIMLIFMVEESVVQLNSIGPWEVNYVNPKDDPRKKTQ